MMEKHVYYGQCEGVHILKLTGEVRFDIGSAIEQAIDTFKNASDVEEIVIDLSEATLLDSTILGILSQIGGKQKNKVKLLTAHNDIEKTLRQVGFDRYFAIVFNEGRKLAVSPQYIELMPLKESKEHLKNRVRMAHEWLAQVDPSNAKRYSQVIDTLKKP